MPRQERERRYISEYMLETFPDGQYQINVELGPIPQEYVDRYGLGKAAAIFRPTRPRVDAVRWQPDVYYLIEAKIRDIKAGIGDLSYYRSVVPSSSDLPYYDGQPIICRLVVPWMLEWLQPVADAADIQVIVYQADWIAGYVEEKKHYFTKEYREKRDEIKKLRRVLGVE